jgi:hypothetical protein
MEGWMKLPAEVTFFVVLFLGSALLFFLRIWISERRREERSIREEARQLNQQIASRIDLLEKNLHAIESQMSLHSDSLREGRFSFQSIRDDIKERVPEKFCVERHDKTDLIIQQIQERLEAVRSEMSTMFRELGAKVDRMIERG